MRPAIACRSCRQQKRRCNRSYPACHNCLKTNRTCIYSEKRARRGILEVHALHLEHGDSGTASWSDLSFLDAKFFSTRPRTPPKVASRLDTRVFEAVGGDFDRHKYLQSYLEIFKTWISIIPPREITTTFAMPMSSLTNEEILLLASMYLHVIQLSDIEPRSKHYLAIKSTIASAEIEGPLTVRLLQSQILILIYEFGHGIYPSAYLTLGRCIDYLTALSIDERTSGVTWLEQEVRRRLWWAVFVLERCIAIGASARRLSISEPPLTTIIPSEDKAWESGGKVFAKELDATLATPLKHGMGNFRLLVLAAHLLSKCLVPEKQTASQLYRTLLALENVIEEESETEAMMVNGARSVLNSAKMHLFSDLDSLPPELGIASTESPLVIAANLFVTRTRSFLKRQPPRVSLASPFLLHWGYRALDYFYHQYAWSGDPEDRRAIEDIEEAFHRLEQRCRLARVYTDLIYKRYVKAPSPSSSTR